MVSFKSICFDLHGRHLDTPGIGLRIQRLLNGDVEPLSLGQHFIELMLPEHRAQSGLGQLAGGDQEVLHLDDRLRRIDHAEVHHRVNFHRYVVARDHILAGHIHRHRPQPHPDHLLDPGNDQHQPWTL